MQQKYLCKKFRETYRKYGASLFTRARSDKAMKNGFKLKGNRFELDSGKKVSTVRVFWEMVDAPILEVLKARLGEVLSNLFFTFLEKSVPTHGTR